MIWETCERITTSIDLLRYLINFPHGFKSIHWFLPPNIAESSFAYQWNRPILVWWYWNNSRAWYLSIILRVYNRCFYPSFVWATRWCHGHGIAQTHSILYKDQIAKQLSWKFTWRTILDPSSVLRKSHVFTYVFCLTVLHTSYQEVLYVGFF